MLRRLTVENYALIEHLEIEFDSSLNIITGETGAGKSILMGALALLLGAKNDSTTIKDGSRACVVEGEFDIANLGLEEIFAELDIDYDHDTIIRRTISPSGKSRAFVNDQPVQLADLKQLGAYLIDIHSQHQNLILSSPQFRIRAIDTIAGNGALLSKYGEAFAALQEAKRAYAELSAEGALGEIITLSGISPRRATVVCRACISVLRRSFTVTSPHRSAVIRIFVCIASSRRSCTERSMLQASINPMLLRKRPLCSPRNARSVP